VSRAFARVAAAGFALVAVVALGAGCTPKVQIEPPKEPIVINMNIKIEHEVRVKVDKDLDELIADDKEIF
jgi:anti-sigma-K factor RskA